VKETARKIGELRGLSMEQVGEQTARNFYKFFKISEIAETKVPAR
jgi:Tat protein secretion system quality control protein TatD with DNase activity